MSPASQNALDPSPSAAAATTKGSPLSLSRRPRRRRALREEPGLEKEKASRALAGPGRGDDAATGRRRRPRRVRALSPFANGRGAANARAARAATGAGDAIDLGRRPAGRETKGERAEETGKTRRGEREGEALWKAREDG